MWFQQRRKTAATSSSSDRGGGGGEVITPVTRSSTTALAPEDEPTGGGVSPRHIQFRDSVDLVEPLLLPRTPSLPHTNSVRSRCYSVVTVHSRRGEALRLKPNDFGVKTIGQKASFVYLVNQIFGTGVIALPHVVLSCGWLPSLLANVFVCVSATLGTLMMLRCMTMVSGNQNFEKRLEFMAVVRHFLKTPLYNIVQVCFYASILASNIMSIIVVAQAVDHLALRTLGFTAGLQLFPALFLGPLTEHQVKSFYSGEGNAVLYITFGYIVTSAICIPLSLQTMEENMKVQYFSFAFLILTVFGLPIVAISRLLGSSTDTLQGGSRRRRSIKTSERPEEVVTGSGAEEIVTGSGAEEIVTGSGAEAKVASEEQGRSGATVGLGLSQSREVKFLSGGEVELRALKAEVDSELWPPRMVDKSWSSMIVEDGGRALRSSRLVSSCLESSSCVDSRSSSHLGEILSPMLLLLILFRRRVGGRGARTGRGPGTLGPAGTGRMLSAPAALGQQKYGELMSSFLNSYSFVNLIPSWANEMTYDVEVGLAVRSASFFTLMVYFLFGYVMAYAYPNADTDNILQAVLQGNRSAFTAALVYAFDLITVAPGILVFCIATRYNLLNCKVCSRKKAIFGGSILPFSLAWLMSNNARFSAVLTWSSLVFSLTVNFLAPYLIFLVACCISMPSIRNPIVLHLDRSPILIWLHKFGGKIATWVTHERHLQPWQNFPQNFQPPYQELRQIVGNVDLPPGTENATMAATGEGDLQSRDDQSTCSLSDATVQTAAFTLKRRRKRSIATRAGSSFSQCTKSPRLHIDADQDDDNDHHQDPNYFLSHHFTVAPFFPLNHLKRTDRHSVNFQVNGVENDAIIHNDHRNPSPSTASISMMNELNDSRKESWQFAERAFKGVKRRLRESNESLMRPPKVRKVFAWDTILSRRREIVSDHKKALCALAKVRQPPSAAWKRPLSYRHMLTPRTTEVVGGGERGGPPRMTRSATYRPMSFYASRSTANVGEELELERAGECSGGLTGRTSRMGASRARMFRSQMSVYVPKNRFADDSDEGQEVSSEEDWDDDEVWRSGGLRPTEEDLRPTEEDLRPTEEDLRPRQGEGGAAVVCLSSSVSSSVSSSRSCCQEPGVVSKSSLSLTILTAAEFQRQCREEVGRGVAAAPPRAAARVVVSPTLQEQPQETAMVPRWASESGKFLLPPARNSSPHLHSTSESSRSAAAQRGRRVKQIRYSLPGSLDDQSVESSSPVEPLQGAEDAYEQDQDFFGEVKQIRIRVFPKGPLRRYHVEATVVFLMLMSISCFITAFAQVETSLLS